VKKWYTLKLPSGDGGNILSKRVICEPEEIDDLQREFAEEHLGKSEDVTVEEDK
jgi:hypothetical protein